MKATLLALAILSLASCHVGSSKDARPADQPTASAAATDKAIEKSRDAMLGKSMNVQSEHWAGTPAAAASTAAPAGKDAGGGAAPAIPSTSAAAARPAGSDGH